MYEGARGEKKRNSNKKKYKKQVLLPNISNKCNCRCDLLDQNGVNEWIRALLEFRKASSPPPHKVPSRKTHQSCCWVWCCPARSWSWWCCRELHTYGLWVAPPPEPCAGSHLPLSQRRQMFRWQKQQELQSKLNNSNWTGVVSNAYALTYTSY